MLAQFKWMFALKYNTQYTSCKSICIRIQKNILNSKQYQFSINIFIMKLRCIVGTRTDFIFLLLVNRGIHNKFSLELWKIAKEFTCFIKAEGVQILCSSSILTETPMTVNWFSRSLHLPHTEAPRLDTRHL